MARREVTARKPHDEGDDADAYTIEEFCRRHRISTQLYYKNRKEMPVSFTIGTRRLISKEAAAEWRREQTLKATKRPVAD